jgi:asparaginyl-tRNA synthetase
MYLTQSWQLYAESVIFSLENIYCVSPCFRAEKSKTSRHLSEFWMAEMEAAWMKLNDVVELSKKEIKLIIERVVEKNSEELKALSRDVEKLNLSIKEEFPTITYTEALKILKEKSNLDIEWGKDLRTVEEDELMKHFKTPVAVVEYPKEIMAFYKPKKDDKGEAPRDVALCFDMLAPEGYGEIIGGSEREMDIEEIRKALEKEGEDISKYDWYLDLRRYGSVPHSGYGVGVERVVAWICGLDNIKDAIPFPRTIFRKTP